MNNFVIGIILYKPDKKTFDRIGEGVKNGYTFYIFDNTPNRSIDHYLKEWEGKIQYFTYGRNSGIGVALNMLCATAYYKNYDFLLYFDQDTIYNDSTLEYISDFSNQLINRDNTIYSQTMSVTFRDDININYKSDTIEELDKFKLNPIDLTISSGSLFFLKNLKDCGWHDKSFFIDGVDYAICLMAEKQKFTVFEHYCTPGLDHKSEQADEEYVFGNRKLFMRAYPWYRLKDSNRAYFKLLRMATSISFKRFIRILKLWMSFLLIQIIARAFYNNKKA